MPNDFKVVWQKEVKCTMTKKEGAYSNVIEKLHTL